MPPVVSILIPHFNRSQLLQQTLDSLAAQSFADWEAIVVDDGSDGDVWTSIQTHAKCDGRIRIMQRTEPPKGPSRCRNVALQHARGDYIIYLDSDDLLAPWCLAQRVQVMEENHDLDYAVFPAMIFERAPGDRRTLWNHLGDKSDDDLQRFLGATPPWCMTSPIWRTQAIRQLGGLNEELWYGTDSELHTRALLAGLTYRKFSDANPDVFVRRDATPRFNSTISPELLSAKRNRIKVGTALLQQYEGTKGQRDLWERRYLEELESLIFNVRDNREPITALLRQWFQSYNPFLRIRIIVWLYALVGRLTRHRAYLILRIARRLTMTVLPERFSPPANDRYFESEAMPLDRFEALVAAMQEHETADVVAVSNRSCP